MQTQEHTLEQVQNTPHFQTQDDEITVRKADHFEPGQYMASAALCSCSRVCVALIDDD